MANYEKQTISKETAQEVLKFFKETPQRDYCLAFSVKNKEMVYWRERDTQWLETLAQS